MSTEENDLIQPDESQVNITDLLLAYLANWKWFLLSVFLCMVRDLCDLFCLGSVIVCLDRKSTRLNSSHLA